ncbi:acyl-ACP desaturase [Nocardia vermiculata]|uniref:Acyl-ACP desaturase n=2 Tax=Nocardia vermiculata TaxID=257274 RepID=A0A846XUU1_9NOCA|nr:acyl-ACP desaturase [Nocardia vermiculata]
MAIAADLESAVADNLHRHIEYGREWFPHQYVPWSKGTDFDGPLGGRGWSPEQSTLTEPVRAALVLSVLTEDNLPSYYHVMLHTYGGTGAWREWVHRWSAEEARHSTVLRDYLHTTRAVDPVQLERARMAQMSTGYDQDYQGVLHMLAYSTLQEWTTRVVHRNTGAVSGDARCEAMMSRLAMDENLHMIFFRNLLEQALERDADSAMVAIAEVLADFRMPGHGVEGFASMAKQLSLAGIYSAGVHHDAVVVPFARHLSLLDRTGLGPDGRAAQDRIGRYIRRLELVSRRFQSN